MSVYWLACACSVLLEAFALFVTHRRGGLSARIKAIGAPLVVISCCIPLLLAGLRDISVGIDTQSYYNNYIETGFGWRGTMEYGFYLLNLACIRIGLGVTGFFVVCSAIFFGFSYAAIHRLSPNPAISVLLLFVMGHFFFFMNIMRQMMAAAILLLALSYAVDRRPAHFALLVFLASSIHSASVVFVVMYFVPRITIRPMSVALAVLFIACFARPLSSLVMWVAQFTRYSAYFSSEVWTVDPTGIVGNLKNITVLAFGLYCYAQIDEKPPLFCYLLMMQIITVVIGLIAAYFPMLSRFQYTFGMGAIALLPLSTAKLPDRRIAFLATLAISAIYVIYAQYTFGFVDSMGTLPYTVSRTIAFF